jgi:hypothetical protein
VCVRNGNVVEKRHRHRPSDLLTVIPNINPEAKDEGRILYELLYVCGSKGWGRTPVACCQRSYRDLNVMITYKWLSLKFTLASELDFYVGSLYVLMHVVVRERRCLGGAVA